MLIYCIGDSTALPRDEVPYIDTWGHLIQKKFPAYEFVMQFHYGLTTNALKKERLGGTLSYYKPDIVIIQLGIVDCAPRYLRPNGLLSKIVSLSSGRIQRIFWKVLKKFRRRSDRYTDVSLTDFEVNLRNFVEVSIKQQLKKVVFIKIGMPGMQMVEKNTTIRQAVSMYNAVINKVVAENMSICTSIDPLNSGEDEDYIGDGYHPNSAGNIKVLDALVNEIKQI